MDDEMMKLKCLELAVQQGLKGDEARREANRMFNQIKGRTEETPDKIETPKATIYRDPPFKDYKSE